MLYCWLESTASRLKSIFLSSFCPCSSPWLCAWRKAKDLLPPLPSSGLKKTMNSHRFVCQLLSHIKGSKWNSWRLRMIFVFQQSLGIRLSKIVKQTETYHPFLMSFSFSRLLETVQSFLDTFLEKNPSDYLLKVEDVNSQLRSSSLFIKCID